MRKQSLIHQCAEGFNILGQQCQGRQRNGCKVSRHRSEASWCGNVAVNCVTQRGSVNCLSHRIQYKSSIFVALLLHAQYELHEALADELNGRVV